MPGCSIPLPAVVILPGPPGAGKGTQARMPEKDFGMIQRSAGDLLRSAAAAGTPAGLAATAVMAAGDLVSDDIVLAVLKDRMAQPDIRTGIIPDGSPRTDGQAAALDAALDTELSRAGQKVTAAISLDVDDAAMVDPVSGRCACATCGGGCHDTIKQPAAAGVCHKCGGTDFARRADDTAETLRARLQACHAQTAPLIAVYDRRGVLERIDAMGPIAEIGRTLPTIVARIAA
jgi:adenylate kinase